MIKIGERSQLGMDRIVAPSFGSDGIGRTRVCGQGRKRVVTSLPRRRANGVDGREVDHVKSHLGNGGKELGSSAHCFRYPLTSCGIKIRAFRARKNFIPRTE